MFVAVVCGCLPPIFPRERWTKLDIAVDWIGLFESIHGLLSSVYREYYSVVAKRPAPAFHGDATDRNFDDEPMLALADDGDADMFDDMPNLEERREADKTQVYKLGITQRIVY
jgi:hypothetical protein